MNAPVEIRPARVRDVRAIKALIDHYAGKVLPGKELVAVDPMAKGRSVGHAIVALLAEEAVDLGLARIFVLTFETDFFGRHGFLPIADTPAPPEVYDEIKRSPDEDVTQFLDLAHIKPNTLGNTRMPLHLGA
ncbi:amino-acid N-acetyltransferase [Saccharopolyspora sp. NPDC002376]